MAKDKSTQGETPAHYPTPEQIVNWKKEFGMVYVCTVDGKKCWLKKPDRKILAAATQHAAKNPLKFNETVLTNCWLAGDEEIKTNDDLYLGVSAQLDQIVTFKEAEIKEA